MSTLVGVGTTQSAYHTLFTHLLLATILQSDLDAETQAQRTEVAFSKSQWGRWQNTAQTHALSSLRPVRLTTVP